MKKDELIALGIDEEKAKQILVLHGKDIESFKATNDTLKTENDGLKEQVGLANTTIESFKKMDVEGIKKSADEYKTKYDQAVLDHKKELDQLVFDRVLEDNLKEFHVKDPSDIIPHLNKELLKLGEDKKQLIGLKEQVDPLVEKKPYLFESASEETSVDETKPPVVPVIVKGTKSQSVITDKIVAAAREGARLDSPK